VERAQAGVEAPSVTTQQGTSGWLWDFLPGRTWAEMLSFLWPDLWPDLDSWISGKTDLKENA
jgi:hypothetical protein